MPNTREKLIELLKSANAELQKQQGARVWGDLADILIANGVTMQEWIPVTERLPKHGEIVLCYTKHEDWFVLQWCEISHRWVDVYKDYRQEYVTHWMPLPPKPPKGE